MTSRFFRWLLLSAALWSFVAAVAAQDFDPLPPWEPPPIPPEPPAEECGFSYIGYIQTSQGVFQDDPQDTDFLQVLKGTSTLSRNLASAQEAFYQPRPLYQVPTFEAGLDMVVGRETYLVGATPGAVGATDVQEFRLYGTSAYSSGVPVQLRVTVVLNGTVVKQFLASNPLRPPRYVRLGGTCDPPRFPLGATLYREFNVLRRASEPVGNAGAIRFVFDEPGRYLVRAELVRDEAAFHDTPGLLEPIGVAVDVRGRVVTTRAPSLQVVPVADGPTQHQDFSDLVLFHLLPDIQNGVQYAMAVPSGPVPTTFYSLPWLSEKSIYELVNRMSIAKRWSKPGAAPDRFVVVVEHDKWDRFIPVIPHLTDAEGVTYLMFKHAVFVRGPRLVHNSLGYVPPYPALKQKVVSTVMHELYHSLGWQASWLGGEGDCAVPPYHGESFPLANGLDLQDLRKQPYYERVTLMGPALENPPTLVSQCTYRYSLEALSQAAIDPPVLMVSGMLRGSALSAEVELAPVYQMDGFGELPQDGDGSWKIQLRDAGGELLASHPFQPEFLVAGALVDEVYFNYTVERPPAVDRIEITAPRFVFGAPPEDVVVASRELSDHAPTLDASAFRFQDQWIVEWEGYDADGDPLLYSVLTSTDGEIYLPTEFFESSQTGFALDDPYGTIRHLKVVATDGGRSVAETLDL